MNTRYDRIADLPTVAVFIFWQPRTPRPMALPQASPVLGVRSVEDHGATLAVVVAAWVDGKCPTHPIVPRTRDEVRFVDVTEQPDAETSCLQRGANRPAAYVPAVRPQHVQVGPVRRHMDR